MRAHHGGLGATLRGHRDHNTGHSPTASFGTGTRPLRHLGCPKGPPAPAPDGGPEVAGSGCVQCARL